MGEITDRFFLSPRLLLSARRVDFFDAISLVAYAKVPLVNVRRGRDLVAGFVRRRESDAKALLTNNQVDRIVDKYATEVASLRFPVDPLQYEPLLEALVEDGEDVLPYFYHEHHLLVDRRRRAATFARLYSELLEEVRNEDVILQRTDSERVRMLVSGAWMTHNTVCAYLERHGVAPWWAIETNLASHARLERVLFSDSLNLPSTGVQESYDSQQMPSFVFAQMLLNLSERPRGFTSTVLRDSDTRAVDSKADKPRSADASRATRTEKPAAPSEQLSEHAPGDGPSPRPPTRQLRPQNQGAEHSFSNEKVRYDTSSKSVHGSQEVQPALPAAPDEAMLSKKGVAALLGVSVGTVDNYRKNRSDFPKAVSYGESTLRWERSAVLKWKDLRKSSTR